LYTLIGYSFQSKALESEIEDLQGEFELDRLDYLETIRKQDQQLKLLTQILEKIQPVIKKDSNYYNLEKVKKDAVWNEDEGRWILPEMSVSRTVLPTAHNACNSSAQLPSFLRERIRRCLVARLRENSPKVKKRILPTTTFKPIRQSNVLNKYRGDNARNIGVKSYFPNKASTFDNLLSGVCLFR
ncbi:hypothetical protein COOONC_16655, partial [Cooperia oncophora]